jgi:excisionase family DNA binding protein
MRKYYTISQAAKICAVDRSTMHRWVSAGKIKFYRTPGRHKRILPEDLKKWLEDNQFPFDINAFKSDKAKILIVDDDSSVQNYLKEILSGIFIDIDIASDGFEAGKKLIQFIPDLMILDLHMPNMDGFDVCKKIKTDSLTKNMKIVILSGNLTDANRAKAISLGADATLEKPSSKKAILDCVEGLLRKDYK